MEAAAQAGIWKSFVSLGSLLRKIREKCNAKAVKAAELRLGDVTAQMIRVSRNLNEAEAERLKSERALDDALSPQKTGDTERQIKELETRRDNAQDRHKQAANQMLDLYLDKSAIRKHIEDIKSTPCP